MIRPVNVALFGLPVLAYCSRLVYTPNVYYPLTSSGTYHQEFRGREFELTIIKHGVNRARNDPPVCVATVTVQKEAYFCATVMVV